MNTGNARKTKRPCRSQTICTDVLSSPFSKKVLEKLSLPTVWQGQPEELLEAMGHDKKMSGNSITVIRVDTVGSFRMEKLPFSQFQEEVKGLRL